MTTGRGLRLAILAMAVPWLAVACGSDDNTSASTSGGSPTSVTTAGSTTTKPAREVQPTVTEEKVTESKPDLTIDVVFPVLAYPGHDEAAAKVNAGVRALVDRTIADFRNELTDLGRPAGGAGSQTSTLAAKFDTVRLDSDVASFRLIWDSYDAGAAHPGSHVDTATFDLATGDQLDLADLFAPDAKYLDTLSHACAPQVEAGLTKANGQPLDDGERQTVAAGTAPKAENYGAWAVSTTAIEVTFQEYQVGPYAVGQQSCEIKAADLASVLKAGGLL